MGHEQLCSFFFFAACLVSFPRGSKKTSWVLLICMDPKGAGMGHYYGPLGLSQGLTAIAKGLPRSYVELLHCCFAGLRRSQAHVLFPCQASVEADAKITLSLNLNPYTPNPIVYPFLYRQNFGYTPIYLSYYHKSGVSAPNLRS